MLLGVIAGADGMRNTPAAERVSPTFAVRDATRGNSREMKLKMSRRRGDLVASALYNHRQIRANVYISRRAYYYRSLTINHDDKIT